MEDYRKKQMTKAQMWDKIHEERRMWMEKDKRDTEQAYIAGMIEARKFIDPIIAKFVRGFGTPEGDEIRLDIGEITPEDREWHIRCGSLDEKTITLWARQSKEEQEPEEEQQEEEK